MVGESINSYWDSATQTDPTLHLTVDIRGELLVTEVINPLADENSVYYGIWGNISRNKGKWYWEIVGDIATGNAARNILFGAGVALNDGSIGVPDSVGIYSTGIKQGNTLYRSDGFIESGNLLSVNKKQSQNPFTVGIIMDLDLNLLRIQLDGVDILLQPLPPGDYFPFITLQNAKVTTNFGDLPFKFSIPKGANAFNCPPSDISPNVIWDRTTQSDPILQLTEDINGDLLIAEVDEISANPTSVFYSIWASMPKVTGKWYWEYNVDISSSDPNRVILLGAGIARNDGGFNVPDIIGTFDNNGIKETKTVYRTNGEVLKNGATGLINTSNLLESFTMGFLLDLDNHTLDIKINDISIIVNGFVNSTLATAEYFPYIALQRGKIEANFGSKTLRFGTPSGFQRYKVPAQPFNFFIAGSHNTNGGQTDLDLGKTIVPVFSDTTTESINTYTPFVNIFTTACNTNDNKISTFIEPKLRTSGRISG